MVRSWEARCEDFSAMHIVTHNDIRMKMQEEIDELRAETDALREIIVDARDWVSVLDEVPSDSANCALRLQWLPRARSV